MNTPDSSSPPAISPLEVPTVHVVIVHLHGQEMLGDCIRSLLASTGVHLEVVLVLNGCTEELPQIAIEHPAVHRVETPPLGFSRANNFAVDWAEKRLGRPNFYYFLNNDTVSSPEALDLQIQALAETGAAVVGPRLMIQGAERHLNSLGLNVTEDGWGWDEGIGLSLDEYGPLPARREVLAVTGSAILVEASVHEQISGWTELYEYYFEDIDYCLKVRALGRSVVQEPEALVLHRISATMSIGSEHKFFLFRRNRLLLAIVHWPLGMLLRLFRIAIFEEIVGRNKSESELERRGLRSALAKLPKASSISASRARRKELDSFPETEGGRYRRSPCPSPMSWLKSHRLGPQVGSCSRTSGSSGGECRPGARAARVRSRGARKLVAASWCRAPDSDPRLVAVALREHQDELCPGGFAPGSSLSRRPKRATLCAWCVRGFPAPIRRAHRESKPSNGVVYWSIRSSARTSRGDRSYLP